MAKKKKRREKKSGRILSRSFVEGLDEALWQMKRGKLTEARDQLEKLNRRYPDRPEVLHPLTNIYYDLKDYPTYLATCEQLAAVRPNNADYALMLAGACLTSLLPVLSLHNFRRFLERWPEHPRAPDARKTVAELETRLEPMLQDLNLSGHEAFQAALLHEQVQSLLGQWKYSQARQQAEELLQLRPDFTAALNNIGEAYFREGNIPAALASAQRTLAVDPENVHALSNLARYLFLNGRLEEARAMAERVKAAPPKGFEVWTKKVEALSYLGDDQGVLDVYRQSQEQGPAAVLVTSAFLHHLAAVAAARLGQEAEARKLWEEALRKEPGFDPARQNLADLRKPVGKRHAPWAFTMNHWLSERQIDGLMREYKAVERFKDNEEAVKRRISEYLQAHPDLVAVIPALLDRGDSLGREFALRMASANPTPEMLAALREFAFSQRGPDEMRHRAAQVLSEAGILPPGPIRIWFDGQWRDVLLMGWTISFEPTNVHKHSPQVRAWVQEAHEALQSGDAARAEALYKQALEAEPDSPDVLNNLAAAYMQQHRETKAEALIREMHARFSDYLFGQVAVAKFHIRDGCMPEAKALLDQVMAKRQLHVSEFVALTSAQIDYWMAEGRPDAARHWYTMWKQTTPEHPNLAHYRSLFAAPRWDEVSGEW